MENNYIKYIVSLGGLTSIQYRVLLLLKTGEYTQMELSKELNTHKANVNKAVNILIDLKLIEVARKEGNNIFLKAVEENKVVERNNMSNKEIIKEAIREFDLKSREYGYESNHVLGCYDNDIEKLDKVEVSKITRAITGDYSDVKVSIGKKYYIVEVSWITDTPDGDEVDFIMKSIEEYENQYGRKFEEN